MAELVEEIVRRPLSCDTNRHILHVTKNSPALGEVHGTHRPRREGWTCREISFLHRDTPPCDWRRKETPAGQQREAGQGMHVKATERAPDRISTAEVTNAPCTTQKGRRQGNVKSGAWDLGKEGCEILQKIECGEHEVKGRTREGSREGSRAGTHVDDPGGLESAVGGADRKRRRGQPVSASGKAVSRLGGPQR
ncbi:predicted protein [Histoplasma capsulatum G186AR]|uniref:Uncharacterized protein n=1 Tax=Ajellomyces capsulatus (strain G186AR / H82 / ATCC MYA-2454 / RMSCC 2432) TaxID=447093 RepID=C0NVR8_AJECG|nr:uncharacterized protein HCBG_07248 [Histoplasma capsulatum G186AR]EEH04607.1 predicted protein [Histoplasma capsulatum G186AR]